MDNSIVYPKIATKILKAVMIFVSFSHPCTRVDVLSDVWVEDVIDMSVEGLVIDRRDEVVTNSLAGVAINVMLVVVVSDVVVIVVVAAAVIAFEPMLFST